MGLGWFDVLGAQVIGNLIEEGITELLSQHFLSSFIDLNLVNLNFRLGGNPIQSSFSFLFLDLEGNSLDWALLNSLHEMGGKSSNFVSESLGGNLSNFAEDFLVGVEVVGQLLVILLEEELSTSFDCLGSDSAHMWLVI